MATVAIKTNEEAKIRELIDHWANAARTSDLDGIMSHYAPDIVAFDAIAQLQFKGKDAYRKHWEACLSMCSGPMIFEVTTSTSRRATMWPSATISAGAAGPGRMAWKRSAGCARPSAAARSTAGGWSCTSISPHLSTWRPARRCSTSSRRPPGGSQRPDAWVVVKKGVVPCWSASACVAWSGIPSRDRSAMRLLPLLALPRRFGLDLQRLCRDREGQAPRHGW